MLYNKKVTIITKLLIMEIESLLAEISEIYRLTSESILTYFLLAPTILLKSSDDSFAFHRRFFRLESTILLESTDDSFGKHREYLGQSVNFISQRCLFLISTDSSWLRQCATRTTQLFYLTHWISLCAIWWRTKMMKSGEYPCQVLVTQNLFGGCFLKK